MNQRRRPQMPPRGPRRPQGGAPMPPPPKPAHYWHHYPYYHDWVWDDYYDYDYDWYDYDWYDYDWDTYSSKRQETSNQRAPKASQYIKVTPILVANLLEYASKEKPTSEHIQMMLDKMIVLSGINWEKVLDMGSYDEITKAMANKQVSQTPKLGE